MGYRRNGYRVARATPRTLVVKYAGDCACCGARIEAGEVATYYPVGTIAGRVTGAIAHVGGLDGNSARCTGVIRAAMNAAVNDYAGDGLDARWEDQGGEICGR
jgi:hypothetical protein